MTGAVSVPQGPAWNALREHYEAMKAVHLRDLFAQDPERGTRLVCDTAGDLPRLFQKPPHE